ncbi:helix-turn-helix domain-containing protein [Nocardiopsis alborubida]|uniref:Helix-turn-helix domain-containing protein n=1 Tax=Nocardiopsis alborubida TaxID=146802 RepID=A0A7X6MAU3_9ACTN|nr:helix-turn-helix domain-containing protein [Nocardiopsis alborubida]NKY97981.1 helix-turn-helix domain-containing protein [Nocardiopsis alborubida]
MAESFYSVDQVAELLGLHVRTIRNYVRDGRLHAVRIGKQYRIAHADLEAFTGAGVPAPAEEPDPPRHTEVSSIVEIDGVDARTADRVSTMLTTVAAGPRPGGQPLRVQTLHDPGRGRMKIVVLGGLNETARLLDCLEGVLAP